jgi:hypothetical protein
MLAINMLSADLWVEVMCFSRYAVGLMLQTDCKLRDCVRLLEVGDRWLVRYGERSWSAKFWVNHAATLCPGLPLRTVPDGRTTLKVMRRLARYEEAIVFSGLEHELTDEAYLKLWQAERELAHQTANFK